MTGLEIQYQSLFGVTPEEKLVEMRLTATGRLAERVSAKVFGFNLVEGVDVVQGQVDLPNQAFDPSIVVTIIEAIMSAIINIMQNCPAGGLFGGGGVLRGFRQHKPLQRLAISWKYVRPELPNEQRGQHRTVTNVITAELRAEENEKTLKDVVADLDDPGNRLF